MRIINCVNMLQHTSFSCVQHQPPVRSITFTQQIHQFWNIIQHKLFHQHTLF